MRRLVIYKIYRKLKFELSKLVFNLGGERKKTEAILDELHNKYRGKRCFIICNGPSLRAEDLTKIHDNGDVSFAMNAIARVYDQTPWRPTFLSLTDDIAFTEKNFELCRTCEAEYKFFDVTRYLKTLEFKGTKFYLSFNESLDLLDNPIFDPDAKNDMPSIGTSAYAVIELAVYFGFREIYILGCDMSYSVNVSRDGKIYYNTTGKEHFYTEKDEDIKFTDVTPNPTWHMEVAFDSAADWGKKNGVKIYNVTRGGMCESFQRVDFDSLF